MFVIAHRANQLGNRLFLFAHLIACAAERRVQLVNLGFEEYARYFETTSQDLFCRYPPKRSWLGKDARTRETLSDWAGRIADSLAEGKLKGLQNSALIVLRSGSETTLTNPGGKVHLDTEKFLNTLRSRQIIVFVGPLFRDVSSFPKHAASIREYFRPLGIFRRNVDALLRTVREDSDLVVGVHLRRGDYRIFVGGRFFYTVEQYVRLMQRIQGLFDGRRVHFLVCSNEEPAKEAFSKFTVCSGSGQFIEDLYALARCDFIVGPPSTFSAWASFYGQVPRYVVTDPSKEPTIDDFSICRG
jgi:hypothetical protein